MLNKLFFFCNLKSSSLHFLTEALNNISLIYFGVCSIIWLLFCKLMWLETFSSLPRFGSNFSTLHERKKSAKMHEFASNIFFH